MWPPALSLEAAGGLPRDQESSESLGHRQSSHDVSRELKSLQRTSLLTRGGGVRVVRAPDSCAR